jgi:hypothetical protein
MSSGDEEFLKGARRLARMGMSPGDKFKYRDEYEAAKRHVQRCALLVEPVPGEEYRDVLLVRVLSHPGLRSLGGFWVSGQDIEHVKFDLLTQKASEWFARYGGQEVHP